MTQKTAQCVCVERSSRPAPRCYNALNQLLTESRGSSSTAYTYDANGNLLTSAVTENGVANTATYQYNLLNQQIGYTDGNVAASYTYNPQGIRTSKTVGSAKTAFLLDGGNVAGEVVNGTATATYLWGVNPISRESGSDTSYYLYNAHGDVVQLANTSGTVTKTYNYDAFGNEISPSSTDTNPLRYCGEYFDTETGTYYLRARYYDPSVGRFVQQDRVRFTKYRLPNEAEVVDPLSLNLYAYCYNSPVRHVDPSGNFGIPAVVTAIVATPLDDVIWSAIFTSLAFSGNDVLEEAANERNNVYARFGTGRLDENSLRDYTLYVICNDQKVVYVGITKDYDARRYSHQERPGARFDLKTYNMLPVETGLSYQGARMREETLIMAFVLEAATNLTLETIATQPIRESSVLQNKIHSIAMWRWITHPETSRIISLLSGLLDFEH